MGTGYYSEFQRIREPQNLDLYSVRQINLSMISPTVSQCYQEGCGHVGSILKHVPDILIFVDVECQITMSESFCVRGLGLAPGALGVCSACFPANL